VRWLIAKLVLKRLTKRNYKLRVMGKLPDEWYWADILMLKWGGMKMSNEVVDEMKKDGQIGLKKLL